MRVVQSLPKIVSLVLRIEVATTNSIPKYCSVATLLSPPIYVPVVGNLSSLISTFEKISPIIVMALLVCVILGMVLMALWGLSIKIVAFFLMSLFMLLATLGAAKESPPSERLVVEWLACCIVAAMVIILVMIYY